MGLLSKLFSKPPEPEPTFNDPLLGTMTWSNDDEAWAGQYKGCNYLISYEREKFPTETVLAYAGEILSDPAWLNSTLAEAKANYKNGLSAKNRAFYNDEIDEITWETLHFGLFRKAVQSEKRRIFATLKPGRDFRSWRIEYLYRTCQGLGFDT